MLIIYGKLLIAYTQYATQERYLESIDISDRPLMARKRFGAIASGFYPKLTDKNKGVVLRPLVGDLVARTLKGPAT